MKTLMALALLPLVTGCSGNPSFANWGDEASTDDGASSGNDGGGGGDVAVVPQGALATGISITDISINQAVEISVVKSGALATKNAPIVAGRKGLVRVFVNPGSTWTPHQIAAALTLHTAGQDHLFTATLSPSTASNVAALPSTFNFNVDAASLGTDTTFFVQLIDPHGTGSGDPSAQFPTGGTPASLGVQTSGIVKIHVFPIHFTSYPAGTAATGGVDLLAYQSIVMGLYPATSAELTAEPALDYAGPVPDAQGNYWDQLLNTMIQLRAGDPASDVYYYGAFAPTSSFDSFCGGGCVAGLSSVPGSPADTAQKASIGLVYGGDSALQTATGNTMAHEVGHGHGREHAPTNYNVPGCSQPSGIDPSYPYTDGAIGVWGYDITSATQIDPTQYFDMMGYCQSDWISDYTYGALFQWVASDNGADMVVPTTPTTYRQLIDNGSGVLKLGAAFPVYGVVSGVKRTVTYEQGGTAHTVTGFYYPYDHVKGGYLLVPEKAALAARPTAIRYAK